MRQAKLGAAADKGISPENWEYVQRVCAIASVSREDVVTAIAPAL